MHRIKEEFLPKLETIVPLKNKHILEIGCGNGVRSRAIAERCTTLIAIEPDEHLVQQAQKNNAAPNITFQTGKAEQLDFADHSFDMLIFTLSFHHVPTDHMKRALAEAVRVVKPEGHIIFLEPGTHGSFFEAELTLHASDGDERTEKASAYQAITTFPGLQLVAELPDETIIRFDSDADFITSMAPHHNLDQLPTFLAKHNYILNAERKILIFQPSLAHAG